MRLLGAVLVVCSGYFLGQVMAEEGQKRAEALEELKKGFTLLKGQMEIGGMDYETMFLEAAACLNGGAACLMETAGMLCAKRQAQTVQEIWEEALQKSEGLLYLDGSDWSLLLSFGRTLGYSSHWQQARQAAWVAEQLEETIRLQKEKNRKDQKLYRTMGTIGALMVLVVLF